MILILYIQFTGIVKFLIPDAGGLAGNGRQNHKFGHTKVVYSCTVLVFRNYMQAEIKGHEIDLEWPKMRHDVTWTTPNVVLI